MNKKSITPFIDALFLFLLIYICIVMMIKKSDQGEPSVPQNVIYQVIMTWDGKSDSDMDLWGKEPTGNITGFKRREGGEGSLFSLNRDDLGGKTEKTPDGKIIEINEELISLRGTKEGEYTINGHLYKKGIKENSVLVTCKLVKVKPYKEIIKVEKEFKKDNDEYTFFRFKTNKEGEIIETNQLQQRIARIDNDDGPVSEQEMGNSLLPPLNNPIPVPPSMLIPR